MLLGLAAVLWVGSRIKLSGELTTGGLSAFILYMFVVAFTVSDIVDLYGTFQQALGSAQRVLKLLDARPDVDDPAIPVAPGRIAGVVQLEGVSVRYSAERPNVLSNVTPQAIPGKTVALVGPTVTPLGVLAGLELQASSGRLGSRDWQRPARTSRRQ